jgi:FkbM family methyltransferase
MAAGCEACRLQDRGARVIAFDRWMLPAGEEHLQTWMTHKNQRVAGRLTYQYHKYEGALKFVGQRRVAVDVGAHVGLWSYWMARDFATLHAFEPKPEHVQCWNANMEGVMNAHLYEAALGNEERQVGLHTGPDSSGDTTVVLDAFGTPMRTLDSFNFQDVDFLKIDCEGFEVFVLEGARETLARCKPTVIVEQKPGHGQHFGRGEHDALALLKGMGARQVWDYAGDYVMAFGR